MVSSRKVIDCVFVCTHVPMIDIRSRSVKCRRCWQKIRPSDITVQQAIDLSRYAGVLYAAIDRDRNRFEVAIGRQKRVAVNN